MHTMPNPLSRTSVALACFILAAATLLAPARAAAYGSEVRQCISKYTYTAQPRMARNALQTACMCAYNPELTRCSQWPETRIDCVIDLMVDARDNNDARQVNTYCKRKAGLRLN